MSEALQLRPWSCYPSLEGGAELHAAYSSLQAGGARPTDEKEQGLWLCQLPGQRRLCQGAEGDERQVHRQPAMQAEQEHVGRARGAGQGQQGQGACQREEAEDGIGGLDSWQLARTLAPPFLCDQLDCLHMHLILCFGFMRAGQANFGGSRPTLGRAPPHVSTPGHGGCAPRQLPCSHGHWQWTCRAVNDLGRMVLAPTWRQIEYATLPHGGVLDRAGHAAVADGSSIYVIGGRRG